MTHVSALVFEPNLSGHRALYASELVRELVELGIEVKLAAPRDSLQTPEGKVFFSSVWNQVELVPLDPVTSSLSALKHAKTRLAMLVESVHRTSANHVYVPYADGLAQAWGMKPRPNILFDQSCVVEGLLMKAGPSLASDLVSRQRQRRAILQWLSWKLVERGAWNRVHHCNPLSFARIRQQNHASGIEHRLIPECIEFDSSKSYQQARTRFGFEREHVVVVCIGAVKESKGCDRLIDTTIHAKHKHLRLLLLGKHDAKCRKMAERTSASDGIVSLDRFASQDEFDDALNAADIVSVCYPGHLGSASILIRAAKAKRAVLASNEGWIRWATDSFELGETCDASDAYSMRDALSRLVKAIESRRRTSDPHMPQPRTLSIGDKWAAFHSMKNYRAHWTDLIRKRCGLPESCKIPFPATQGLVNPLGFARHGNSIDAPADVAKQDTAHSTQTSACKR